MRRHPSLIQLSREHHGALKIARRARLACESGDPAQIAECARHINEVFPKELEPHFQEEENGLLPALIAAGESEAVLRTLYDHARLRVLNAALAEPDAALLAAFGQLLADHARFEERELFESAQRLLYRAA